MTNASFSIGEYAYSYKFPKNYKNHVSDRVRANVTSRCNGFWLPRCCSMLLRPWPCRPGYRTTSPRLS